MSSGVQNKIILFFKFARLAKERICNTRVAPIQVPGFGRQSVI